MALCVWTGRAVLRTNNEKKPAGLWYARTSAERRPMLRNHQLCRHRRSEDCFGLCGLGHSVLSLPPPPPPALTPFRQEWLMWMFRLNVQTETASVKGTRG